MTASQQENREGINGFWPCSRGGANWRWGFVCDRNEAISNLYESVKKTPLKTEALEGELQLVVGRSE